MPHYFDPSPAAGSRPTSVVLTLPDLSLELQVDRGVFAAGGVDAGTIELLRTAPATPLAGDVLDLGCGYGPIAVTLARRYPDAKVWAVDVNERALALATANAAGTGVGARVTVGSPDSVPSSLLFSAIWSNPPIRIGKEALHSMLQMWLPRLEPGGVARLVVHKHLGSDSLARWLESIGWPTRKLSSRKGYRILEVGPREVGSV